MAGGSSSQKEKAARFRELHRGPKILVLPNAWDVASARVIEEAGFPAIATSSGAVAASLGYSDGEAISRQEMLGVVARIARAVAVPVSADMEAGYGTTPDEIAEMAAALLAAGAIGLNFEDGPKNPEGRLTEISQQVEKLRAIRKTADAVGVPLVINARVDTYLLEISDPKTRFAETVERARAYRQAGADCIFPIGLADPATIRRLVSELGCPVNILVSPKTPSLPELQKFGVARASFGSGPMRAGLGALRRLARELLDAGTCKSLQDALSSKDFNRLFAPDD